MPRFQLRPSIEPSAINIFPRCITPRLLTIFSYLRHHAKHQTEEEPMNMSDWLTGKTETWPTDPASSNARDDWLGATLEPLSSAPTNPFSLLPDPSGGSAASRPGNAQVELGDALEQLMREAEAALRDPEYVSTHVEPDAASEVPMPPDADPDPLQSLSRSGQGNESLFDILERSTGIDHLADPVESLDGHELFAVLPAPDVLRLFAGDIVPTRRRDIAAPLTRREHHLVSMDSAYRPAQAQTPAKGADHVG